MREPANNPSMLAMRESASPFYQNVRYDRPFDPSLPTAGVQPKKESDICRRPKKLRKDRHRARDNVEQRKDVEAAPRSGLVQRLGSRGGELIHHF